jgi:hypothetical protein
VVVVAARYTSEGPRGGGPPVLSMPCHAQPGPAPPSLAAPNHAQAGNDSEPRRKVDAHTEGMLALRHVDDERQLLPRA